MELLLHINKRVRPRPEIQLPMDALIQQYQDPRATSFVLVNIFNLFKPYVHFDLKQDSQQ